MQIRATVAIGVAIVSFVMATVLVPSLSALIGKRVWWPGRQEAVTPLAAEERSHPEPRPSGEPAHVGER